MSRIVNPLTADPGSLRPGDVIVCCFPCDECHPCWTSCRSRLPLSLSRSVFQWWRSPGGCHAGEAGADGCDCIFRYGLVPLSRLIWTPNRYQIITADTSAQLSQVQALMEFGWQPLGGVSHAVTTDFELLTSYGGCPSAQTSYVEWWSQAMVGENT